MANIEQESLREKLSEGMEMTPTYRHCAIGNSHEKQRLDTKLSRLDEQLSHSIKIIERNQANVQLQLVLNDFEKSYNFVNKRSTGKCLKRAKVKFIEDWRALPTFKTNDHIGTDVRYKKSWSDSEMMPTLSSLSSVFKSSSDCKHEDTSTLTSSVFTEVLKKSSSQDATVSGHYTPCKEAGVTGHTNICANTLTCFPLSSARRHGLSAPWKLHGREIITDPNRKYQDSTNTYLSRDVFDRLHNTKASLPRIRIDVNSAYNVKQGKFDAKKVEELSQCRYLRF